LAEAALSLSVVVVAHDMARELPRTLASLSPRWQHEGSGLDYEVIVVDNGSSTPIQVPNEEHLRLIRLDPAPPSPARAANIGIAAARGDLIGVLIDGARMCSPGLVRHALLATRLDTRPVIATLGFHLGPKVQPESVREGYDQAVEDQLLEGSGWTDDGYRLFGISVFAVSSAGGWFAPFAESNALFMSRMMWQELRGYDERFVLPGGGLVNLDTFARACELPASQLVVLLGEGTFHQVHGGVATNALVSPAPAFHAEYQSIRGRPWITPDRDRLFFGRLAPHTAASVRASAGR
jgi:glycosyltransferase involved in cell wall biosynthesis